MNNDCYDFLNRDTRWDIWDIDDIKKFEKEIVVHGKFHSQVPLDIIHEYEIVERLMYYSFFHYPLMDEAFSKATRVFELAIKLRCKELGLTFSKNVRLSQREKALESYTAEKVYNSLAKIRELRNYFAHPDRHGYAGIILWRGFSQMVNVFNQLFLPKEKLESDAIRLMELQKNAKMFNDGLFVLDNSENKYLVFSASPFELFSTGKHEKSFWAFHPVLTSFPQNEVTDMLSFPKPLFAHCVEWKFEKNKMTAFDLISSHEISLYKTTKIADVEKLENHKKLLNGASMHIQELYLDHVNIEMSYAQMKFLYDECWDKD